MASQVTLKCAVTSSLYPPGGAAPVVTTSAHELVADWRPPVLRLRTVGTTPISESTYDYSGPTGFRADGFYYARTAQADGRILLQRAGPTGPSGGILTTISPAGTPVRHESSVGSSGWTSITVCLP